MPGPLLTAAADAYVAAQECTCALPHTGVECWYYITDMQRAARVRAHLARRYPAVDLERIRHVVAKLFVLVERDRSSQ